MRTDGVKLFLVAGDSSSEPIGDLKAVNRKKLPWLHDNLNIIIGGVSISFIAIRFLGVAQGDPETAYAILEAVGTGTVLVGSMISSIGILAIPALGALIYYSWREHQNKIRDRSWSMTLQGGCIIIFVLTVYITPIIWLLISVVIAGFFTWFWHKQRPLPFRDRFDIKTLVVLGILSYFFALLSSELIFPVSWLPAQAISVVGKKTFSGYTLSASGVDTVILTRSPAGIMHIPTKSIKEVTECTPRLYWLTEGTLTRFAYSETIAYPACP